MSVRSWNGMRCIGAALLALGAACGGDGSTGPTTSGSSTTPFAITVSGGSGQTGTTGNALAAPILVRVTSARGTPLPGVSVAFQVTSGSATVTPSTAVTDTNGEASAQVTLGDTVGPVQVTASVAGTTITTTVAASSIATLVTPVVCGASNTVTLAPGQVMAATTTGLCVTGAASAEYVLIPFNAAATYRARAAFIVQPSNIDAPVAITSAASTSLTPRRDLASLGRSRDFALEARLRERTRRELTPLIPAARAWYAQRNAPGVRRSVVPANAKVGDLVTLNANSNDACTNPDNRTARVAAIGSRSMIVADTANPTGGYTDAEYQSIAVTFDTLVDAVDRRNFGDPTDIDGNGHVVLFFTSAVNALTPRNSGSFVGGFFDSRDLFPLRRTGNVPACATSNVGELFYLLVPDPGGMINGNRFSKSFVTTLTLATTAHEYEHLINASRRLYVNAAAEDFEEPWLDEGLAHVAEELLFYARSGLGPRRNIDAATLRSSPSILNTFSDDAVANFDRLGLFLAAPSRNSPYADNDSLETRGATWSFLRYATDQRATTAQETIWRALVGSPTTGLANLQQVFGGDLPSLFRDWATSLLMDDVAGASPQYQMLSWNLRSVFAVSSPPGGYPLQTVALSNGAPTTTSIVGGSASYLRFAVGAGKTAALSWNALPSNVLLTVTRIR
jgi:hypothetical protein